MAKVRSPKEMTHVGVLIGDARHPGKHRVKFRETKLHWVTSGGVKYRKRSGSALAQWAMYHLDIDSIRPLDGQNAQ